MRLHRMSILLLTTMLGVSAALADKYRETVVTESGDAYTGYICFQSPNKGEISIKAEYYTRTITAKRYQVTRDQKVFSELPQVAKKWYEDDRGEVTNPDETYVDVVTIYAKAPNGTKNYVVRDGIVIEDGDELTFVGFQKSVHLSVADVKAIQHSLRDDDATAGIVDVFSTPNGDIEGQMIEQVIGKSFRVLMSNGTKKNINIEDVTNYGKAPLEASQGILAQAPMVDEVTTIRKETIKGYIISRDYENAQIVIMTENGIPRIVRNTDIESIKSYPTGDFEDWEEASNDVVEESESASDNNATGEADEEAKKTKSKAQNAPASKTEQPKTSDNAKTDAGKSNGKVKEDVGKADKKTVMSSTPDVIFNIGGTDIYPCCAQLMVPPSMWAITDEEPVVVSSNDARGIFTLIVPDTPENKELHVYELRSRSFQMKTYQYTFSTSESEVSRAKIPTNGTPAGKKKLAYKLRSNTAYAIVRSSDNLVMWFKTR